MTGAEIMKRAFDEVEVRDHRDGFQIIRKCMACYCCWAGNGCCRSPKVIYRSGSEKRSNG